MDARFMCCWPISAWRYLLDLSYGRLPSDYLYRNVDRDRVDYCI